MCVCVCVCVCVGGWVCGCVGVVRYLNWLVSYRMECIHPVPCKVSGSSDSDGELLYYFLKQETNTHLLVLTQEYNEYLVNYWGPKRPSAVMWHQPLLSW